ncbi:alanine and glycine-rich protein-like [Oryza brachyantha]|uniref:alanine and glycine-rich protein-like n=1 Tax=Oryza brachyantha TaxID=4533 RepID=UPI001AD976F3|nr:alanine and glycine-rich protein-like [Oryza brachyantha]
MASRCFFPREAEAGGRHNHQSKAAAAEALQQLHHGGRVLSREDVGGAVRVKIVVSKRELKHMVAALGSGAAGAGAGGAVVAAAAATAAGERHRQRASGGGGGGGAGPGAEQRLQSLRRRSMRRAAEAARRMQANGEWEPGLQSIPEEVY